MNNGTEATGREQDAMDLAKFMRGTDGNK